MSIIQSILAMLPNLTHLRLITSEPNEDYSLFDGYRWEKFIQTNLLQSKQFEFCFLPRVKTQQDLTLMDALVLSYQTPFWIENKHWIVKFDCESKKYDLKRYTNVTSMSEDNINYFGQTRLYTIPIIRDKFGYFDRQTQVSQRTYEDVFEGIKVVYEGTIILNSVSNIIDNNQTIIVDVNELILNVNSIIMESIQDKNDSIMNYKFQNVKYLTLLIYEKWPINLIEHLSTIVNLWNIDILILDFQC
ncbi:unnamed protein product [Adineta steineri]|nr:unnamed protein product [Adineta steineri]